MFGYLTDWLTDKINSNLRTLFVCFSVDLCTSSSEMMMMTRERDDDDTRKPRGFTWRNKSFL